MPVPQRLKEIHFREFAIIVARSGSRFIAVGRDRKGNEIARVEGAAANEVEANLKAELPRLSNDFVDMPGAINLFRRAFPGGLCSAFYAWYERDYKAKAAAYVQEVFAEGRLRQLASSRSDAEIAEEAGRCLSKTNLTSRYEQMALKDALRSEDVRERFGHDLVELLYGDTYLGIDKLSRILKPKGAAKWPVITYWPFLLRPERHMLLKPEIAQLCAHILGYELDYDPVPNARTYRSYLGLVDHIRNGIAVLEPRDNIDVQTFMYVVGKEGYLAAAIADRRKFEEAREH
jgi:hypothetical protein